MGAVVVLVVVFGRLLGLGMEVNVVVAVVTAAAVGCAVVGADEVGLLLLVLSLSSISMLLPVTSKKLAAP